MARSPYAAYAAAFVVLLGCSPSDTAPIDTAGTRSAGGSLGGGSTAGANEEAGSSSGEAGIPIPPSEAGVCGEPDCTGCCTPTGTCAAGTSSSECGVLGAPCISCPLETMCAGGICISQPQ